MLSFVLLSSFTNHRYKLTHVTHAHLHRLSRYLVHVREFYEIFDKHNGIDGKAITLGDRITKLEEIKRYFNSIENVSQAFKDHLQTTIDGLTNLAAWHNKHFPQSPALTKISHLGTNAVEWYFSTVRRKVFKPNFMSFYQYQRAALLELIKKHNVDSRYKGHKNVFNTTRNYNSNQDLSFCQALLTALTPKFTRGHQSKLDSRSNAADTGDKGVGAPAGNKNAVQPNTGNAGSASTTTQDQHSVQEPSTQGPSNKKLDTSSLKLFAKAYPYSRSI
ncbi:hypothetical protein SAMD00019534_090370 [Acytostelium subglobosum LB1]|uniref:hypothetical protein n=1 Tax=Acytostelium subglobosum LB1 TaxID=1410327 RepID=UPI000644F50C|nr:hypothetical protein SAMD00019534_090370 [Acytostelium subglobosum LB1]GAM25863.1 hypothetical protein SAMD00019534_090370 [Acytostelium subglobosum LB1]|eukprot:XP_012751381.1 hypothetical protein SAMD00019534_090370 [Acytostelium subglobosum LB1]